MFNSVKLCTSVFCWVISFTAFSATVSLDINGLEDLGPNARYEGWLIVNNMPVSTGVFSVNELGELSQTTFNVSDSDAAGASVFILTIEPFPDLDSSPADSHLLAGDVNAGLANVTVGHPAAIGDDLTGATGIFELSNPTGDKGSSFENGIWYVVSFPPPVAGGLNLPTLPAGWIYEGWVVDGGTNSPISTGVFNDENGPDSDGAGPAAGAGVPFSFPGQDFINPSRDLSMNHTAVISVEPVPDNAPSPFVLKPLLLPIAGNFGSQLMINNALASNPFGQVDINLGGGEPGNVQAVPVLGIFGAILLCLLFVQIGYIKLTNITRM